MFKDSKIAKGFKCSRTKLGYLITFGIAPAVRTEIVQDIRNADNFVLMFDESLNPDLQKKQLDVHIRFLGGEGIVKSKYLDSLFLDYSKAQDIQKCLQKILIELGSHKLVQLSMDGPNVNWKVFKDLTKVIQSEENVTLLNIGSCGLHVVHNSFKRGLMESGWDLGSLLRSLYYLFKDSPTRKADYLKLGAKAPLKFCGHRWLENIPVAERAIEIWPHVLRYISAVKKGTLSNPTCASFKVVCQWEKDTLLLAKLNSFVFLAKILKPFLVKFQKSEPLAPFLCDDLFAIIKRLYGLILVSGYVNEMQSYSQLEQPKDIDKSKFKTHGNIEVGFKACQILEAERKNVSDLQIMDFRMSFQKFVKACIKKILEKSPLNYKFAQDISCFNPIKMQSGTVDTNQLFRNVSNHLVDTRHISSDIVDDAIHQYEQLKTSLKHVPFSNERLDEYFVEHGHLSDLPQLQKILNLILILSHGNADVERGFSINKEITIENLQEQSLKARRLVCQYVCGKKISEVILSPEIIKSCGKAWTRYSNALKEMKDAKEVLNREESRKRKLDEVEEMRTKRRRLLMDIDNLVQTADDLSEKAETAPSKRQHELVIRSNALRRDSKLRSKELDALCAELQRKEKELE